MKKLIITGIGILGIMFFISCGGADKKPASDTTSAEQPKATTGTTSDYDPKRGEGKFDSTNVTIGPLDAAMAAKGKSVAETKCFSCHKTSDEKLVGPGWKGITERKTPYWIMNFITNPDPMIDKDPELQAQLEICLVRMPNQNLVDLEARELVEFMRQNDGAK
ncbi:MAG: c-type cytochrome [Chitinophagaceae bacterium]|nr:c-type cytochrome [Chitinophagaceae bacterium]MBK9957806.1 c-type cytochrome [Chitinophagaceae bacterium]MBP6046268.1 c-type cytochrome [Ferruginibacter sp.]HRB30960.1 c-type cytochrome [Ferruginibacter sp.]